MNYEFVLKLKPWLKKAAMGPFRWLVVLIYRPVVHVEMLAERVLDRFADPVPVCSGLDQVTAVIKTFERPRKLKALVCSIQRLYPDLKIIVVDDSQKPSMLHGVTTIVLPYDSGVSAGRAAGLERVTTPFVLNLDDDFIFNRDTELQTSLKLFDQHPEIDLIGGDVIYLPLYYTHDYLKIPLMGRHVVERKSTSEQIGGLPVLDKTANFFMARTDAIRAVGWDVRLKRMDHGDFFTRAKGHITTVFHSGMKVLHVPSYFNQRYMERKQDNAHDSRVLWMRYGRK